MYFSFWLFFYCVSFAFLCEVAIQVYSGQLTLGRRKDGVLPPKRHGGWVRELHLRLSTRVSHCINTKVPPSILICHYPRVFSSQSFRTAKVTLTWTLNVTRGYSYS